LDLQGTWDRGQIGRVGFIAIKPIRLNYWNQSHLKNMYLGWFHTAGCVGSRVPYWTSTLDDMKTSTTRENVSIYAVNEGPTRNHNRSMRTFLNNFKWLRNHNFYNTSRRQSFVRAFWMAWK
jgi:hypothetical protein